MNQHIQIDSAANFSMMQRMLNRRSAPVLVMEGPGPDAAELQQMLTAASRVPDHGKLTPWRFIVFEGDGRARAGAIIAEVFVAKNPAAEASQVELERKRLLHAPLVVAVVSKAGAHAKIPAKIPEWEQVMSAGAVCMNLVWAANALGFVTSWLTQWYAYDRAVLDRFGLTPDEKIAGFIHIGRRHGALEDRPRPALNEIVTRF